MRKKDLEEEKVENLDQEVISQEETEQEVMSEEETEEVDVTSLEIENLKKANAELLDRYQRSLAEFDNFRKRTMKEKSQMHDDGVKDTIEKLLPIIDNFERAIGTFENKEDATFKGFEMIFKQLQTYLCDISVETIVSVGEVFDTNVHFAVAHIEDDAYGENEVVEELQKGYKYKDKVIRCSMVKVAN